MKRSFHSCVFSLAGRFRTAGLALLFSLALFAPRAVLADEPDFAPGEAELHYAVSWLEIPVAEASARLRRGDGKFSARGESWAVGPLAAILSFRGFAETRGEWGARGPIPREHRNGGEFWGKKRTVRVWWAAGGSSPQWEALPRPDLKKVSPVPAEELSGALDPFTAVLSAGARIGRAGACEGAEKVWDGRRLADWTLAPAELSAAEEESPDAPGAWSGGAMVCELRLRKIGGFRRDSRHSSRTPPRVWVAEVLPGLWAPVRAEVYGRWGKVIARLDVRKTREVPPTPEVARP